MSAFTALLAQTLAVNFDLYGDDVLHRPMQAGANVNAAPIADATRPVSPPLRAIYYDPAVALANPQDFHLFVSQKPGRLASRAPRFEFAPGAVLSAQTGDLIERLSDGRRWRIAKAWTLASGILVCDVNAL